MQLLLQLIYNLFNINVPVFLLRLIVIAYSEYTKQRILFYWFKGIKPGTITLKLEEGGIDASRVGVWKFLKRYENHGTIQRKPGSGRCSKITAEVLDIVNKKQATTFASCNLPPVRTWHMVSGSKKAFAVVHDCLTRHYTHSFLFHPTD